MRQHNFMKYFETIIILIKYDNEILKYLLRFIQLTIASARFLNVLIPHDSFSYILIISY